MAGSAYQKLTAISLTSILANTTPIAITTVRGTSATPTMTVDRAGLTTDEAGSTMALVVTCSSSTPMSCSISDSTRTTHTSSTASPASRMAGKVLSPTTSASW